MLIGGLLTKPTAKQGLGFGTEGFSLILFGLLVALLLYETLRRKPAGMAEPGGIAAR